MTKFMTIWLASLAMLTAGPAWGAQAQHSSPSVEDIHAAEADTDSCLTIGRTDKSLHEILHPESRVWRSCTPLQVRLNAQTVSSPAGGGSTRQLDFRALRVEDGIAFRIEWPDTTRDDGRAASKFKDALAIQFPIEKSGDTRLAMGHSGSPVNILYWSAEPKKCKHGQAQPFVEELVAAGSLDRARKDDEFQLLQSASTWRSHRWCVVIFKPTVDSDKASPDFSGGSEVPVAFAVWNGSAGERLGMKSVSSWNLLRCR